MNEATITEAELQRLEKVVDVARKLRAARENLREWTRRQAALIESQEGDVARLEREFAEARQAAKV